MFYDFDIMKSSSESTLNALFDSPVKVRLIKLFLYNSDVSFESKILQKKLSLKSGRINKDINDLVGIKFLSYRNLKGNKTFRVNPDFSFYNELRELVIKADPASKKKMMQNLKKLGTVKLALLAGIFTNSENSQADLLVVGDRIKKAKFNIFIKNLEAEIGKEISYALLTTKEFYYRHDMYDRFIHDLLDFKHEKLIDKLKI